MSQLKKLAGETVWYGLSSIIGRVISYVLTPLYTSVFLPGEYGVVTELYAYAAFFNVVYMYGMETAFFRYATKEKEQSGEHFNTVVSSILTTSLICSGLLALFAVPIMDVLGYQGKEQLVYWLAMILAIDAIVAIPFAKLRLAGKARRFAAIRLTNVLLSVILNLFFLVVCDGIMQGHFLDELSSIVSSFYSPEFKVKYVFLSNLLANGLFLLLLVDQFSGFKFRLSWTKIQPMLKYGYPIMLMAIAGTTNEMLSRALLKYILPEGFYDGLTSMDALGIFGACYKLSVFMMLGTQAFRYAAEPFFFSKAEQQDSGELFSKVMKYFVIFNALVFLAVSVNLEILGVLFLRNPVYREGLYVVPFLLMGYLFWGIYYNLSVWYKVTDKTQFGAYIVGVGAIVTIVANFLLIPILGYFGSALVTLITYFLMTATNYFFGQKNYPVPYKVGNAFFYILTAAVLSFVALRIDMQNLYLNFVARNAILVLFLIILLLKEKDNLKGLKLAR